MLEVCDDLPLIETFKKVRIARPRGKQVHQAITERNIKELLALLSKGACPDTLDDTQSTPLERAFLTYDRLVIKILLRYDANPNREMGVYRFKYPSLMIHKHDLGLFTEFIRRGYNVNTRDEYGGTALHHAVQGGCYGIMFLLIEAGCNVNTQDIFGKTPFYYASLLTDPVAMGILLCAGADPSIKSKEGFMAEDVVDKKEIDTDKAFRTPMPLQELCKHRINLQASREAIAKPTQSRRDAKHINDHQSLLPMLKKLKL